MRLKKFIIAGGNKTTFVWDAPLHLHTDITTFHLQDSEQVGFVSESDTPTLTMMGNELCINATLALAYHYGEQYNNLYTSGISTPVYYKNTATHTSITFSLVHSIHENIVLFEGIGFLCTTSTAPESLKYILRKYAQQYNLPAFGFIQYDLAGHIYPAVYVTKTDSLIHETSCGSGSIAVHLITGIKEIIQPTGRSISVMQNYDTFTISAQVQEVTTSSVMCVTSQYKTSTKFEAVH